MTTNTPCRTIQLSDEELTPLKATELRIGNWVIMKMLDGTNVLTQVPAVGIAMVESGQCEVFGIGLTEDILGKCGFTHAEHRRYFKPEKNKFGIEVNLWSDHVSYTLLDGTHIEIKYLHQLQNLHYSLTGEELKCEL